MGLLLPTKQFMREDEWEIDFNDTRDFLIESWIVANEQHKLSPSEVQQAEAFSSKHTFTEFVHRELSEARKFGQQWKIPSFSSTFQFALWLGRFEALVQNLIISDDASEAADNDDIVDIKAIDTSPLWMLAYLNVKLCMTSQTKARFTIRLMKDLQRSLELLVGTVTQVIDQQASDDNSMRTEVLEVFDPVLAILHESVIFLQRHFKEDNFGKDWPRFLENKIREPQDTISVVIKHIQNVSQNSRFNRLPANRHVSELGMRDRILPSDGSEKAIFPLEILPPFARTEHFFGRTKDIDAIHQRLGNPEEGTIRKFHIYGRRGIGKTQIALEYARVYKKHFDAIFWIQCETRASLRQSFADIAVKLELEGADANTNFDENLIRVLRWLRQTKKKWLLIYDNAERDNVLTGCWPNGGTGAMLLTSRSFFNFFDDEHRHGETVQVFDDSERRELFLAMLGPKWQAEHLRQENLMSQIEEAAITTLLQRTGGLPIAITHAASIIVDEQINPTQTARHFMELFQQQFRQLSARQTIHRDPLMRSLDVVWAISFDNLSSNARTVLSCLSQLSPDSILIDLFYPSDVKKLTRALEFCRIPDTNGHATNGDAPAAKKPGQSIETVITQSSQLQEALDELVRKSLVKVHGRQISIHRFVQEAIIYDNSEYLRSCFDAVVNLLYDAFPKQEDGAPLQEQWMWCRMWIQHVLRVAHLYKVDTRNTLGQEPALQGIVSTDLFVKLLANCAWYLYEIADYEECLNIVSIGRSAPVAQDSLDTAHLLNTEGNCLFELNGLKKSREAFETCLEIRQKLLPPDHLEIAIVLANLGNVDSAEGNLDSALDNFTEALKIREAMGDAAAIMLGLNYMQIGRVHALTDENAKAYRWYQKCEGIFNKKVGRNVFFTAYLHYDYGNLFFKQGDLESAGQSYETARQFAKDINPLHPLVASACYKLGCVQLIQNHHKKALGYLSKALDVAEVRSPGAIDGTIARIRWKMAQVKRDDPFGTEAAEAGVIQQEMEMVQREIAAKQGIDLRGIDGQEDAERSFDLLVPGYLR